MDELSVPSRAHQLNVYFRNPEYLAYLQGQLRASNVLDYFSTSEFYEQGCNNALLRQQGLSLFDEGGNTDEMEAMARLEAGLRRLVGIEYVVAHARPPDLFVIHKRQRNAPDDVQVLEAYYVLHGDIRMAADLYTLLGSRLLSTLSSLQTSMGLARRAQERFSPRQGHAWRVLAESAEDQSGDDEQGEEGTEAQEQEVASLGAQAHGAKEILDANVAAIATAGQ